MVLATQIFNNILTAIIVTRMYPKYKPVGRLEKKEIKKINGRIKDMFTGKIGSIILNSADTIVISSFLGLTTLASLVGSEMCIRDRFYRNNHYINYGRIRQ